MIDAHITPLVADDLKDIVIVDEVDENVKEND